MAKKKKLESKAPVPLTRGQLSRAQREQQRIRNLYTIGIGLGVMVVLLLGFAVISTFIIQPNAEVASVNGAKINRAAYNKLARFAGRRFTCDITYDNTTRGGGYEWTNYKLGKCR